MDIDYNSPVVLTFVIAAIIVFGVNGWFYPELTNSFFVLHPTFAASEFLDWFRLASHVLGHANFEHLFNNIVIILLLGPILEERYGSSTIFWMMLITAVVTGIINHLFFSQGLLGASGIAFSFIILVSIVNVKRDAIPLSFILIFFIFIGGEVSQMYEVDNISQTSHIIGGIIGAATGFYYYRALGYLGY